MTTLPSIFSIPGDDSGRYARDGFNYQDHIGAWFCIEMLKNDNLLEVWLEHQDDITLIWKNNKDCVVEFVQVKSENRESRWSIASLTERSNGFGSSIFEKSIQLASCHEKTMFRLVTAIGVNRELEILTYKVDSIDRASNTAKLDNISTSIKGRLGNFSSLNCTTIDNWVRLCYWDTRAPSENDLASINILELSRIISANIHPIAPDQAHEIYQKLLAKVKDASSIPRVENPLIYKIEKVQLVNWLADKVRYTFTIEPNTKRMIEKMSDGAKLPSEIIENAKELRIKYIDDSYRARGDYVKRSVYDDIEFEVTQVLNREISGLDSGRIKDNGVEFHDRCMQELHKLREYYSDQGININESYLSGYMYYRTNRCVHRFIRATP